MKKILYLTIIALLIVGLMLSSGCTTLEDKDSNEDDQPNSENEETGISDIFEEPDEDEIGAPTLPK